MTDDYYEFTPPNLEEPEILHLRVATKEFARTNLSKILSCVNSLYLIYVKVVMVVRNSHHIDCCSGPVDSLLCDARIS